MTHSDVVFAKKNKVKRNITGLCSSSDISKKNFSDISPLVWGYSSVMFNSKSATGGHI